MRCESTNVWHAHNTLIHVCIEMMHNGDIFLYSVIRYRVHPDAVTNLLACVYLNS